MTSFGGGGALSENQIVVHLFLSQQGKHSGTRSDNWFLACLTPNRWIWFGELTLAKIPDMHGLTVKMLGKIAIMEEGKK